MSTTPDPTNDKPTDASSDDMLVFWLLMAAFYFFVLT